MSVDGTRWVQATADDIKTRDQISLVDGLRSKRTTFVDVFLLFSFLFSLFSFAFCFSLRPSLPSTLARCVWSLSLHAKVGQPISIRELSVSGLD